MAKTGHDSINNVDYGLSQLVLTIPPNSTKSFSVTIKTNSTISLEAYVSSEWFSLVSDGEKENAMRRKLPHKATARDWMCCQRERFECAADAIANIVGSIPGIPPNWNCATQIGNTALQAAYDVWCSDGESVAERFSNYAKSQGESLAHKLIQSAISCVTRYFKIRKQELWKDRDMARAIGNEMEVARITNELNLVRHFEQNAIISIYKLVSSSVSGLKCVSLWTWNKPNCPPGPQGGGTSTPQPPYDPNDIYGYLSDAGSKFMTDEVAKVDYTIEFENDTAFAQASAHTIVIRDTLDSRYFDLKSFLPTSVKIGERETFLDETEDVKTAGGVTSFLKTIDMRPEINAIAQVEGEYSQQTGIAKWTFTSLDPMTMEPTDDLMQGILPVNYNGTSGIGEVMFEVGVKPNKADGTQIPNRAGIVFDYEASILTPTWVNTIDGTAPTSHVTDVRMESDSTAAVSIAATDELSGPWRYNVYVQYGSGAWFLGAENVPIDKAASIRVYEGIDHGFYVVVTDSAGNVEQKAAAREFSFEVFAPQEDTNTQIELAQGWNWVSHNQQEALPVDALKPASTRMVGQTEELFEDARFGWMGDLEELLPTQLYKVQVDEPQSVQLSGLLFNAAFRSIPLYEGWNWIGYPVAHTMTPAEALARLEAEEGDMLIGQDGLSTYSEGLWTGTLTEMVPGLGYMYLSQSDKNLFYNATAQASARRMAPSVQQLPLPDGWTVDKRKYPNVMGVIAVLMHGNATADAGEWTVGAFSGGECRGISTNVGGQLMMNVYGQGGEPVVYYALNPETGELLPIEESEPFVVDVLGTMQMPYTMHVGKATGISDSTHDMMRAGGLLYDLQGRRVDGTATKKGIYVSTEKKFNKTQKVIRR